MRLWELLRGAEALSPYPDLEICGICTDSRRVGPGYLYVCIPGFRTDGHLFAGAAERQGAAAILAERDTGCRNQILVRDTREAYALCCANFFGNPARELTLVGVTGTNGKTSVATVIKRILCQSGVPCGLISTIQAEWGEGAAVPLERTTPDAFTLQGLFRKMADAGIRAVAMECSSHALDQKRLFGLRFSVAVFTNLTQDHLDYHKSMLHYFEAKKKLFTMADAAVVNWDDPYGRELACALSIPWDSCSAENPAASFFARGIECTAGGVGFSLRHGDAEADVWFGIPGRYSVLNAMEAAAACLRLGVSPEAAIDGLRDAGAIRGRNERIETGRGFTVLCDYAHTPDGLENILKSTREYARGRLVVLFGCGGNRDREKRPLMGAVAAKYADFLIVTSDNPRTEPPAAIIGEILKGLPPGTDFIVLVERRDAIRYALATARPGDTLILAGKGHETYQTLGEKNLWFDERRLVKGILLRLEAGGGKREARD